MTPEAQRIAMAEVVPNWRACHGGRYCTHLVRNLDNGSLPAGLFDPLNDLNAMHEAEKVLTDEQHQEFLGWLTQQVHPRYATEGEYYWHSVHATATQRAEAFLRTIGKWVD